MKNAGKGNDAINFLILIFETGIVLAEIKKLVQIVKSRKHISTKLSKHPLVGFGQN